MDLPAVAVIGASAADLFSTEFALSAGCYEANPLMRERPVRIGLKAASTVAVLAGTEHLKRHGHSRAASVLRWSVAALWASAAVWNVYQMRRAGQ